MRILLLGLNYHPELVGIGRYTGEMAAYMAEAGVEICVITTPPYYPAWRISKGYSALRYQREKLPGVEVIRCPLWVPRRPSGVKRLLHLSSFALSSLPIILLEAFRNKPDVVMCVIPTLLSAPFALLAARISSSKSWLHIQDFELDAAFGLGMLPENNLVQQLAKKFESFILTRFDHISTISENMRKRCIQKGARNDDVSLFINWVDTNIIRPLRSVNSFRTELQIPENQVVVLYHGNMGRKQGLEILIECAEHLRENKDVKFVLCGEGAARHELELRAGALPNLHFMDLQPEARLNELVNLADIHILPQRSGAADLVMPSKLTHMLASGKPVIACADPFTQVWEIVHQVGMVVPPENSTALEQMILVLAKDLKQRERLGQLGRDYAGTHLEKDIILNRFMQELDLMRASTPRQPGHS
jgi:colanic acid biosynthesis glycosyl transferase WcaI